MRSKKKFSLGKWKEDTSQVRESEKQLTLRQFTKKGWGGDKKARGIGGGVLGAGYSRGSSKSQGGGGTRLLLSTPEGNSKIERG